MQKVIMHVRIDCHIGGEDLTSAILALKAQIKGNHNFTQENIVDIVNRIADYELRLGDCNAHAERAISLEERLRLRDARRHSLSTPPAIL